MPTSRPRPPRTKTSNRPRRAVAAQPSFFERYRTPIIALVALVGLALVGVLYLAGNSGPKGTFVASGPKYVCDSLLTPGPVEQVTPTPVLPSPTASPTASPAPSASAAPSSSTAAATDNAGASASPAQSTLPASPAASGSPQASPSGPATPVPAPTARLGFTTSILGRNHISNANQTIEYGFCPPTSGDHYNIQGVGPIRAAVYPNNAEQPPGGWVHNLEHGWVVLLYSCKNGCPSADEMAQLQAWYDQAPTPDPSQGCDKEVLVARFDSMDTRFALVAWGRALLTDNFDLETGLTFAQQWMDPGSEPEKTIC